MTLLLPHSVSPLGTQSCYFIWGKKGTTAFSEVEWPIKYSYPFIPQTSTPSLGPKFSKSLQSLRSPFLNFPLTYMALIMAKRIIHYGHCPRWQPAKPVLHHMPPLASTCHTISHGAEPTGAIIKKATLPLIPSQVAGRPVLPLMGAPVSTHKLLWLNTLALTAHRSLCNFLKIIKGLEFYMLILGRAVTSPVLPSYKVQTSIPRPSDLLPWLHKDAP